LKNAGGLIAGNNIRQCSYYTLWHAFVEKCLLLIAMLRVGTKHYPVGREKAV